MLVEIGKEKGIKWSAAHVVPEHSRCRRVHGHTFFVMCKFEGDLDRMGMVIDFGKAKVLLSEIILPLDHLWNAPRDKVVVKEDTAIIYGKYCVPKDEIVLLDIPVATAESFARYIAEQLVFRLEEDGVDNINYVEVGVEESPGAAAWYRKDVYSSSSGSYVSAAFEMKFPSYTMISGGV